MHQGYKILNVQAQENDPDSVLNCYKELIKLRKSRQYLELFTYGVFIPVKSDDDCFIAYQRKGAKGTVTVYANLAEHDLQAPVCGEIIFKTGDISCENNTVSMSSGSALVLYNAKLTL